MKDLIIIGAGGFGRELAWVIKLINEKQPTWKLLGFVDSDKTKHHTKLNGIEVLGDLEVLENYDKSVFLVCAIANTVIRKKIVKSITNKKFATIIAPDVLIGENSSVGEGSIVCSNSIITVDTHIGKHCILDFKSMVGHDTKLEDFVTLYPNVTIAGNVILRECVEMGTCSNTNQGIEIGAYTKVGSGAVVVSSLKEQIVAVGIPAKEIKKGEDDDNN